MSVLPASHTFLPALIHTAALLPSCLPVQYFSIPFPSRYRPPWRCQGNRLYDCPCIWVIQSGCYGLTHEGIRPIGFLSAGPDIVNQDLPTKGRHLGHGLPRLAMMTVAIPHSCLFSPRPAGKPAWMPSGWPCLHNPPGYDGHHWHTPHSSTRGKAGPWWPCPQPSHRCRRLNWHIPGR